MAPVIYIEICGGNTSTFRDNQTLMTAPAYRHHNVLQAFTKPIYCSQLSASGETDLFDTNLRILSGRLQGAKSFHQWRIIDVDNVIVIRAT